MKLSTNISNYLKNLFYTKEEVDAKIPSSEATIKSLITGIKISVGNDYNELLIDTGTLPVLDSEAPYLYLPNSTLTPIKYKDNGIIYEVKNNFLYVNNTTDNNSSCAQIMYPKGEKQDEIIAVNTATNEILRGQLSKYYRGTEHPKFMTPNNTGITVEMNGMSYSRIGPNPKFACNMKPGEYILNITTDDGLTARFFVLIKSTILFLDDSYTVNPGEVISIGFLDTGGWKLTEGTEVQFNMNGTFYTLSIDSNGYAGFVVPNITDGNYTLTIYNTPTSEAKSCAIEVKSDVAVVLETSDVTLNFMDGTKFTALVKNSKTKNPISDATVKFILNGTTYERTTNDQGIASLPINLIAGTYTMQTIYGSYKNTNTIIVNA